MSRSEEKNTRYWMKMFGGYTGWLLFCCVVIFVCIRKSNCGLVERAAGNENIKDHFHDHHHHDDYYNHNHKRHDMTGPDDFSDHNDNEDHADHFDDDDDEVPKIRMRTQTDEDLPDYPLNEIRNAIENNALIKQYFAAIPVIGSRDGIPDEDDGESLCRVHVMRTYFPKTLRNARNVSRIIVNDDKDYQQAVEETRCVTKECSMPYENFGYTSSCEQNFGHKRLLVFENSTKKIVFDEFKIASCCVCKLRKKK